MAPKRKPANDSAAAPTRVTRSSTRLTNAAAPPAADPKPPKKKVKIAAKGEGKTQSPAANGSKTIIIEHCKQCNSFKTRAFQVKEGLQKSVAGVNVLVNPEKPRRGCFEIREEGGEVFVSLLGMKRPFPPLRELDMDELISEIVDKIR
ncbi:hypothetical protein ACS0TY_004335 [Phlomoides rotata]